MPFAILVKYQLVFSTLKLVHALILSCNPKQIGHKTCDQLDDKVGTLPTVESVAVEIRSNVTDLLSILKQYTWIYLILTTKLLIISEVMRLVKKLFDLSLIPLYGNLMLCLLPQVSQTQI